MLSKYRKRVSAAMLCAGVVSVTPAVLAQEVSDCADLDANPETYGRVIWGAGGSAVTATLGRVAIYLASRPIEERITIVYYDPGACQGYQQYLENAITGNLPSTSIKYWIPTSAVGGNTCTISTPHEAHFAHMGNPHDFCGIADEALPAGYPTGYGTVQSPVQTLNFIVDRDSSQKAISAEALYYIYKFGAEAANIAPWTAPTDIVFRQTSSFVHQFVATSIFGNDEFQFFDDPSTTGRLGARVTTNGSVVSQVSAATNQSQETSLGFASGSAVETATARTSVKTLAYQHYDQTVGYWPDSTETSLDKANVRSGKYHFWSPGHFYARVADGAATDGFGDIVNFDDILDEDVRKLLRWFNTAENEDVLRRIIEAGDIPLCAQRVTREGLAGAISSVAPADPCHGFFESVATGSTSGACGNDDECSSSLPVCRHGFCEAY
jgi:hypothetical protein